MNPKHIVIRQKRAEQYLKQKNYLKCMKDCNFILNGLEENNIRCLIYLSACYLAIGDKDKAIDRLVQASKFHHVDDEYRYVLGEIKEWESAVFIEITDPEFIPEEKRYTGQSYAKPKTKPSYEDKYKQLFQSYSAFCMPPPKDEY